MGRMGIWALAAFASLGACAPDAGNSGANFLREAAAGAQAFSDLGSLPTAVSTPASGTASFAGGTEIRFFAATSEQFALVGDSSVAVDFATGTLSGNMAGFQGGVVPTGAIYPETMADYAGSLAIRNGRVGSAGPGSFGATFDGTVAGAGNVVVATGGLLGEFKGTPVEGIVAVGAGVVTLNGEATTGLILELWGR